MANFGYVTLVLALVASLISVVISVSNARREDSNGLGLWPLVSFGLISISVLVLLGAIFAHDFSLEYVAQYSSRDMSLPYLFSAWWAGNSGSLLFWAWVLSLFAVLLTLRRSRDARLLPYATAIVMFTEAFFLLLLVSVVNPFQVLPSVPADGQGMNPLLENPGMIFHPPALLAGYVALTIPFALALAALLTGRLDRDWSVGVRRWALLAWLLLGVGNVIGAWWAYVELGWGGYWAWDPVENAGLMPWLTVTAFLHSTMAERRRGIFKGWNMTLIILSFVLAIFGTFLTRSGILSSVHSFGATGIEPFFATFLVLSLIGSLAIVYYRRAELRGEAEVDSLISRESAFLFNNLLLAGSAFAVFIGTIFPAISEALQGTKIEVGAAFFNMVNAPLYLLVIVLAGACILIGWQRKSGNVLARDLLWPAVGAAIVTAVLFAIGVRLGFALVAFFLLTLVLTLTVRQWVNEVRDNHKTRSESYPRAFWGLLSGHRSRYGGYLVHIGIVLMAIGVAGSSFYGTERELSLVRGDSADVGDYRLTYDNIGHTTEPDRLTVTATLSVYRGDKLLGQLTPQKSFYQNTENPVTEVAIRSTPVDDVYVILEGAEPGGNTTFTVLVNPLVIWIWIGGTILGLGGLLAFWPGRRRELAEVAVKPGACPKCGAPRYPEDRFCARCGARFKGQA